MNEVVLLKGGAMPGPNYPCILVSDDMVQGDTHTIEWFAFIAAPQYLVGATNSVSVELGFGVEFDLAELERIAIQEAEASVVRLVAQHCGKLYSALQFAAGYKLEKTDIKDLVRLHLRGLLSDETEAWILENAKSRQIADLIRPIKSTHRVVFRKI